MANDIGGAIVGERIPAIEGRPMIETGKRKIGPDPRALDRHDSETRLEPLVHLVHRTGFTSGCARWAANPPGACDNALIWNDLELPSVTTRSSVL
jgi:hypothetical protein